MADASYPKTVKPESKATLVFLSAKTGKEIKAPKSRQQGFYGVKIKGKVTRIDTEFSQGYSAKEFQAIQDSIQGENFTVYEELTGQRARDEKGKLRFRKDSRGKDTLEPYFKTKLSVGKVAVPQRRLTVLKGKVTRGRGFHARSRRELVDDMLLTVLKPATTRTKQPWNKELEFTGPTLRDTIRHLRSGITVRDMQRHKATAIHVEGVLRITGLAVFYEDPITFHAYLTHPDDFVIEVSKAIRFRLADHGYRFTSLVALRTLADLYPNQAREIMRVGAHPGKPVSKLLPLFPEHKGKTIEPRTPRVFVRMKLTLQ